jgi:hypothetical protein
MARRKLWDVHVDGQSWLSYCVIARYHREAVRRAKEPHFMNLNREVTRVKPSPRSDTVRWLNSFRYGKGGAA